MGIDFKRQVNMHGLMAQREHVQHKYRQSESTLNGPQTLNNVEDYEPDVTDKNSDNMKSSERSLSEVLRNISSASRAGNVGSRSHDNDLDF